MWLFFVINTRTAKGPFFSQTEGFHCVFMKSGRLIVKLYLMYHLYIKKKKKCFLELLTLRKKIKYSLGPMHNYIFL